MILVNSSRIGENLLPDQDAWSGYIKDFIPEPHICGSIMKRIASAKDFDSLAYKVGARTGGTVGRFNHIRSVVWAGRDKDLGLEPSREYVFVQEGGEGPCRPFGKKGDSGSMVFSEWGDWIGLIWGGPKDEGNDDDIVYVTDAQPLLDQMHEQLGKNWRFRLP